MTKIRTVHTNHLTVWLNSVSEGDLTFETSLLELEKYTAALRASEAGDTTLITAITKGDLSARLTARIQMAETERSAA